MKEKINLNQNKILIAGFLVFLGVLLRVLLHNNLPGSPEIFININGITQNMFIFDLFFVVAIISILSGILLGGYYTYFVPITVMIITDLIIGNNWILLFTWSGFAFIGIIGYLLKTKNSLTFSKIPRILGAGIIGILLYDIWTNFGTWLGGFGYSLNIEGLTMCYTMALPFMFWHLLSTTICLAIVITPIIYLKEHKINIPEFSINPIENRVTLIVPAFLLIFALLSVLF